jgi:hypothetical protein
MALPGTRADLASWIINAVLQSTAVSLEWTTASTPVVNMLDEIELDIGHTIAAEGATRRLLALTRVKAWQAVVEGTVDRFRVSSDGQTVDLQQVHEHAVEMLARVQADYIDVLANPDPGSGAGSVQVVAQTLRMSGNPYAPLVLPES